ncbi:MAG: DUF1343 domain-containing protein [Verrucomicrobiota bacterium]
MRLTVLILFLIASPLPAQTLNGIDTLQAQNFAPLENQRLGLITNHTGRDRTGTPTIDLLHKAPNINLVALFSPEHGIRGEADENVDDETDAKTGLPVHSLYRENRRKPTPDQLAGLDALVFDIQDIGTRFYTYISTMGLAMEAAAENDLAFFVLDRVNPIGGLTVDGPVHQGEKNFTGHHPIPIRHGMTVGELANMFNAENKLDLNLTVIPVENWSRDQYFDTTGLPWINPSPNMRSLAEAVLYPGVALLEFTNVSVGRGTDIPFELVGAPYIDQPHLFADALNQFQLPGVTFKPAQFKPKSSVFAEELCGGARIILTDPKACPAVDVGLALALTLRSQYPDHWDMTNFYKLLKHPPTVDAVANALPLDEIHQTWFKDRADFESRRRSFLLYDSPNP